MTTLSCWLIQALITTTLIVPIVMILCQLFSRRPSMQHALWVLVLIKFVTPPFISLPVGIPTFVSAWAQQMSVNAAIPNAIPAKQLDSTFELDEQIALSGSANQGLADGTIPSVGFLTTKVLAALFLVWLVGAIARARQIMRQVRRQLELIRNASPASDEFAEKVAEVARKLQVRPLRTSVAAGIVSPFVWCVGRLQIIWPQSMTGAWHEQTARSIIAHELSHVRRRDHWIAWLEMAAGFLWWWNPLYWFVRSQVRTTAEMACDAIALANYPDDRCMYAETLFALSVSKSAVPALGIAVGAGPTSSLERRIAMMMSENVSGKLSLSEFLAVALLGLVALPTWSLAQDAPNDDQLPRVTGAAGQPIAVVGTEPVLAGDMAAFIEPIIEKNRANITSAAEEQKLREQLTRQALRQYVEVKALYQEFFRDMMGTPPVKELKLTKDRITNRAGRLFLELQVPVLFMKYEVDTIPALEAKLQEKSLSLSTLRALFVEQVLASELERKYVSYKFEIEGEPAQVKDFTAAQGEQRQALSAERRSEETRKFRDRIMARTAVWTLWPDDIPGARPLAEHPHWRN